MTEKQRFLIYTHLAGLLANVREKNNASICEAVKFLLSNDVIQKLEDLETGYYLESDAYLERTLNLQLIKPDTQFTDSILDFTVFCIENVAEKIGVSGDEIYRLLTRKSDILDSYIIPSYDSLHTQGKEYIVNDIIDCMREQAVI